MAPTIFHSLKALLLLVPVLCQLVLAQQYAGDVINNTLPGVPGSEISYFKITDPAGKAKNLTLINYMSLQQNPSARLVPSQVQRAIIVVHGLNRDPGTYMSNMLSALSQVTADKNVNFSSVAIMAPYFPNGYDKYVGYPWTPGLAANKGSTSNALVWTAAQWASGANNQYPWNATTVSSYEVLDQLVKWFDNKSNFPNMKHIVVAGHSLGAQTINRYAEVGNTFSTNSRVSYWIGNPNSYGWMSTSRPLSTTSCPTYDNWREGFTNYTSYPMTYGTSLVASGRSAVLANYNSRSKAYARGTQDLGDDSSTCAPFTTGANRNERFFNFLKAFPATCSSTTGQCDTIDYVNAGHDAGAMFASQAGQARLFLDDFYGDGKMAYDFGYPRQQTGDDPYPNPALNATSTANLTVYSGNMTYAGCWTDNTNNVRTFPYQAYDSSSNTIELCTSTCASQGYTIAGLEYASQCFCGNNLTAYAQQTVDSGCTQPCAGNSSESCGNGNRLSLYSNGTPAQLPIPGTPEVIGDYNSYHCYTEATSGRALSATSFTDSAMTLDKCANFCQGYMYFGVEFGTECYCGSYFNSGSVVTADSDCSMTCPGNQLQLCGAGNRLTTYVLTSGGTVSVISQGASSTTTTTSRGTATSSGSVSATTAAVIASASACPAADGQVITDSNGNAYTVHCSSDSQQGSYTGVSASSSYLDCMTQCDSASAAGCVGFVYVGGTNGIGSGTCWLKTGMGSYTSAGNNFIAAVKASSSTSTTTTSGGSTTSGSSTSGSTTSGITSSAGSTTSISSTTTSSTTTSPAAASATVNCPSSNGTTYTAASGASFLIECGVDHYAGDLTAVYGVTFGGCIEACATTTGCVDVALSGTACYMKSSVGAAVSNAGIFGAKLISGPSSSTTTSATTTSAASTTSTISTTSAASTATTTSAVSTTSTTSAASTTTDSGSSSTTTSATTSVVNPVQGNAGSSTTSSSSSTTTSATMSSATTTDSTTSSSTTTTATTTSSSTSTTTSAPTSTTFATSVISSSTTTSAPTTTTTSTTSSSSTTTTTSSTTSASALPTGFSTLGCYTDSSTRTLSISNGTSKTQTPAQCALSCRALGYKYSGTEYSSECWCDNTTPTITASSGCSMTCSGDSSQICGGPNRLSVVVDNNWKQTFFARSTYSTWNLVSCYTDSTSSRTLGTSVAITGGSSNATIANCLDACAKSGLQYCGAEYYSECYGSNTVPAMASALSGDPLSQGCNYPCSGNKTESCGGANRVLVYINNGTSSN